MNPVNPFLFIVGAARSGTTLLQRMMDSHPDVAVVNETYWIPRPADECAGLTREGFVTPALIPLLLQAPKFARMNVSPQDLDRLLVSNAPIKYANFVSGIFDLYAQREGKTLAGDKSPGYARKIEKLGKLWPTARFIHLIRDGRDVYLSMASWSKGERVVGRFPTWSRDSAVATALWWRWTVKLARDGGQSLSEGLYREVRYESLVADPEQGCRSLCTFLGIPYDEAMLRFHEGRTRVKPGHSTKSQWLPPTSGLRDWSTQMPSDEVERFEAAAGDVLEDLGYSRAFPHPGSAARDRVATLREAFTADLHQLRRRRPRGW
jgi:hypothetical protein